MVRFIFVLFIFLAGAVSAQTNDPSEEYFMPGNITPGIQSSGWLKKDNLKTTLSAGTMFGSFGGSTSYSSWLAPKLSYRVSPKLTIGGGLCYSRGQIGSVYNYNTDQFYAVNSVPFSSSMFFIDGQYQLSPNVKLSGATWYQMSNYNFNGTNSMQSEAVSRGYMFGLDYKIGNKAHVGFQIEYNQGPGSPLSPHNTFGNPAGNHFFQIGH